MEGWVDIERGKISKKMIQESKNYCAKVDLCFQGKKVLLNRPKLCKGGDCIVPQVALKRN